MTDPSAQLMIVVVSNRPTVQGIACASSSPTVVGKTEIE